jgi:hypothetical protein
MCEKSCSKLFSGIKKEDVWELWSNPKNWSKWHSGLEYCALEGDFKTGSYVILHHHGVGRVKILITRIEKEKEFTSSTSFFGAHVVYKRLLEEKPEGLLITFDIEIKGLLSFFWYWKLKDKIIDCMPSDIEKLAKLAVSS